MNIFRIILVLVLINLLLFFKMENLIEDEFVILKDESCQIVLPTDKNVNLRPGTLYLTNQQIFVTSIYDKVYKYYMKLNDISKCFEADANGTKYLKIVGSNPLHILSIYLPDQQTIFAQILQKMLETLGTGHTHEFDILALSLQRRVKKAGSLDNFYNTYNDIKEDLIQEPPTQAEKDNDQTIQLLSHFQPAPFQIIAVIEDLIKRSELLLFATIGGFLLFFTLVFMYIPFGFFVTFTTFVVILKYGIDIIFAKENTGAKKHNTSGKWRKTFRKIIGTFEKFRISFDKRLLWKNPKQTLDVEVFLLSVALIFLGFDPAFVLATALFGQGFVERWNPFGFGSLWEIITNLFSFNK